MNNWIFFLIGITIYSIIGTLLYKRDKLPSGLKILGPLTIFRSQRGIQWIDKTAKKYSTTWHRYGTSGAVVAGIVMVLSALLVGGSALYTIFYPRPETAISDPVNMLVIPGLNDFLPMSAAPHIIAGLVIGLVIHEGGHAIMCRIGDISIASVGTISFAVIPLGAFVEPNEDSVQDATRPAKLRMYAAGVMNNFVLSFILLVILIIPILGAFSVAPGAAIGGTLDNTASSETTLEKGDRITHINNTTISSNADYQTYLSTYNNQTLALTLSSGETITLERKLTVTRTIQNNNISLGTTITHIDNASVHTTQDFANAISNKSLVTAQTTDGKSTALPIGAVAKPQPDSPLTKAGLSADSTVTITAINNHSIQSSNSYRQALSTYSPGETITIETYTGTAFSTHTVTISEQNNNPSLGASIAPGVGGIVVDDDGVRLYPAEHYLGLLKHGQTDGNVIGNSVFGHILMLLQLPAAGTAGVLQYNFAGFTAGVGNFYSISGPLSMLGAGTVMGIANFLFWVSWVNINLGIFNCIPTYPLDGGHIVRELYQGAAAKLPVEPSTQESLAKVALYATIAMMIAALYFLVFG